MTLFLPLLAVLIGGHEFRNRQLAVSVLAVPRRGRLLAAKVLATAGFLAGVAILIAAISTVFTYLAVKDWWPGLLLTPAAVGVQVRFVGYAVLFGLAVLACTIIGRGALAGAGVMLALIAVTMTQVLAAFAPAVDALFPLSAGRNLLLNPAQNDLTAGPAHAAFVLTGWAVVTLTIAAAVLHRRPAR
jgi:ABC-2 type transport system permease protein